MSESDAHPVVESAVHGDVKMCKGSAEEAKDTAFSENSDAEVDVTRTDDDILKSTTNEKATEKKVAIPANKELLALMKMVAANEATSNLDNVVSDLNEGDKANQTDGTSSVKLEGSLPIDENERKNDARATSDDGLITDNKATSDISLKSLTSKFSRIGEPQLIARTHASTVKTAISVVGIKSTSTPLVTDSSSSTTLTSSKSNVNSMSSQPFAPSTSGTKQSKRTERFLIKNVSKVSKIYKVSNLSYKIRPVKKGLVGPQTKCPVIFIGEPAFTDLEEFSTIPGGSLTCQPDRIKEEDLYDISKLQKAFSPKSEPDTKSSFATKYPCPDIPHPSLNRKTNFATLPSTVNRFLLPSTIYTSPSFPHLNPGSMIRIVARTVPSATVASHIVTNAQKVVNFSAANNATISSGSNIKPGTLSKNVVVKSPISARQHAAPQAPKIIATSKVQATQSTQNLTSVKQDVMTVKLASTTTVTKSEALKIKQQSVKILPLQKEQSVKILPLQKVKTSSVITTGKDKAPVVFVRTKKDISSSQTGMSTPNTNPVLYEPNDKVNCAKTLAKIACKHTATTVVETLTKQTHPVVKVVTTTKEKNQPVTTKPVMVHFPRTSPSKPLREGVEVLFEDGVRHFITSLKQMTYQDDEPIKSWSDLKKGAKVAARWVDGQMYDATVVGCYFSMEKKLQPVVEVERLPEKKMKMTTKIQKRMETGTNIGCAECRKVFVSVLGFRKHQKVKCKSLGVIVPKSASTVTDAMIKAVQAEEPPLNKVMTSPKKETTKLQNHSSRKRGINDIEVKEGPPQKKRKIKTDQPSIALLKKSNSEGSVFQKGTKFLHRWQLDDGSSKWYRGEVVRVISIDKAFLDREFEVSYKDEDENYVLKLYEDYPADIRILGKT